MKSYTLLFELVEAAQEAAAMLQAQWDACNSVEISALDYAALHTAAKLVNSHYW